MKKRILSILLAVLMVISIIPAVALTAFADGTDTITYRTDKTYEGYKDLWVSDGLYAYVDFTGITSENTGTGDSYDENDVFIQGTVTDGTTEGKGHYFIKVLDGALKDKYLMLTAPSGAIGPDANGTLKFTGYTTSASALTSTDRVGVHLGAYYESGSANGQIGGITRLSGTSGYGTVVYGTQTDFYYVATAADSSGYYGGFSMQANAIMDMVSALPGITDAEQNGTVEQKYKAYFMRGMYGTNVLGSIKLDKSVTKMILGTKQEHNFGTYVTVTNMSATVATPINIFYTINHTSLASSDSSFEAQFAINNTYTAVDKLSTSTNYNTTVSTTINPVSGNYTKSMPLLDATIFNYSSFRIYSRGISGLEVNRNHFADLAYYYGLDIPESISLWADSGKVSMASFYGKFVNYQVGNDAEDYAAEIAEMQKILDDTHNRYAAPPRDNIETVYNAYKSLYYDDGHLISFVALSGIEDADIVSQDSASFEDEVDNALLLVDGASPATGMRDYHNFIKIIGGKNAGKYYVLGTSSTGSIGVNSDGFVTYSETWQDDKNVGVFFGAVFDKEALHYKFEGVNDLEKGNSAAEIEFLNQHVTYETFHLPKTDLQVDNTYGTYSIERISHVYHAEYQEKYNQTSKTDFNIHLYSYNGSSGIGTFRVHAGGTKIEEFGTGTHHNLGAWKHLNLPAGSTIHYVHESFYINNENQFENTLRILVNEDGTTANNAKVLFAGGDVKTYDFQPSNASAAHTIECGKYTYYLRLYDCSLTDQQMLQNHFADLALHYRLDVSELLPYGAAALTESFLNNFVGYSLGAVNTTQIGVMQKAIDDRVAALAATNIDEAKAQVLASYNTILESKNASAAAVSNLQAVIDSLDANKDNLNSLIAEVEGLQGAIDIITDSIAQLDNMIAKVASGKISVDELNATVVAAESAAKDANTAAQATSDIATLFANMNIVNDNLPKAVENSDKAVLLASQAAQLADNADSVVKYAKAAKAKESMDTTQFVKFQGYQLRVTDYAAIRALFAHDASNISAGYTFGDQHYDIVAIGYVFANATDDISDITVMLSGNKYISTAENATVVMHNPSFAVSAETKAQVADSTLDIYGVNNSMHDVGVNSYKSAFTQDYMYRAFIVFEGEETSFINYVDCISTNLGESTSIYDAAAYLKQNKPNEWYMDSHYWIAKVIFYSEDN